MKLRDITNSKCDVRKYMSIEVSDEARYELENWDYDVDDVLSQACISVDGHKLDDEITPFNVEKYLELNENQQIVLDVLKKNANQGLDELIVGGITYMNDEEIDAIELSQQEELYQVLAAFAEWGMKNDK